MKFTFIIIALCVSACSLTARANVTVNALFTDHMVAQRDKPIAVWGTADAGESVTVKLDKDTAKTTADAQGKWSVKLDALPAGGPHTLTIAGKNTITIKDVLVGEVWFCSGQSNMVFKVNRANNYQAELKTSDLPRIRMFTTLRRSQPKPIDEVKGKWELSSPETVGHFSAAAYFFARDIQKQLDVPVGLIVSAWGGTPVEAWTSMPAMKNLSQLNDLFDMWNQKIKRQGDKTRLDQHYPANLFNAMVNPIIPYTIRGALWYQGEHNASHYPDHYGLQLSTMIRDWRTRWNLGDFPFYYVQLPNFHDKQQQPVEDSGWVNVRQGMFETLKLPHTGMAITTDIGEADNIHPKNKQDVGHRLARLAMANDYGKSVIASGPIYTGMKKSGKRIIVSFDFAGKGLTARGGEPLKGFAIAGADGQFVWAEAKIIAPDSIAVSAGSIANPTAVRYNWAANPVGNLVNSDDLPASPFKTD